MDCLEKHLPLLCVDQIYKNLYKGVMEELLTSSNAGIYKWNKPSKNLQCLSSTDKGAIQHPYHELCEFVEDHWLNFPMVHNCSNCVEYNYPCLNCWDYCHNKQIPCQLWKIK